MDWRERTGVGARPRSDRRAHPRSDPEPDPVAADDDTAARDHTAGDIATRHLSARDVTARDVTARDVTAGDLPARDLTAGDQSARDLSSRDVTARYLATVHESARDDPDRDRRRRLRPRRHRATRLSPSVVVAVTARDPADGPDVDDQCVGRPGTSGESTTAPLSSTSTGTIDSIASSPGTDAFGIATVSGRVTWSGPLPAALAPRSDALHPPTGRIATRHDDHHRAAATRCNTDNASNPLVSLAMIAAATGVMALILVLFVIQANAPA